LKDVTEASFNAIMSPSRIQFVIPIWQRTYSWEWDQWQDLWEDLMDLYERLRKGESANHFLGPIVLKTVEEKVGKITRRVIIDGQQRLATLLLLCALIRDKARGNGDDKLAEEIDDHLLFNEYAKKTEDKPKLCPTEADRKIFNKILSAEGSEELGEDNQLSAAYAFFEYKFEEEKDRFDLEGLLDCIRALKMVTIRLEEDDNPNRIFETLNFRGKELAQADLVRNYFMMAVEDESIADQLYKSVWFPMQQNLGKGTLERAENLEDFIRHYVIMIKHATVKKDETYREVRQRLKYATQDEVISELKTISTYSKHYEKLLFPERESNMPIGRGIERLNRLRVGVHYPFLLKVYNGFENGTINIEDFLIVLKTIESYVVRRIFQRLPTHSLNRLFADLCKLPQKDVAEALQSEFAGKESWAAQYWPSDSEFKESFSTLPIYSISPERCRFVLKTLEESFEHPEKVDLSGLWIEHVMPETLSQAWKDYLGESWEDIYDTYVHTIGNLTLIAPSPNESIKNKLFSEKKKEWYQESNVSLTKEINKKWDEWRPDGIQGRAKVLAERALKIWPRE